MKDSLRRYLLSGTPDSAAASTGLLLCRLLFGLTLALTHGRGTLEGFLRDAGSYPDPIGLGSELSMALMLFAELFCALLIAAGAVTRLAAAPLVIGFSVAVLFQHSGDPFADRELAFLYLSAFATLWLVGPGRYSADWWLFGERMRVTGPRTAAALAVVFGLVLPPTAIADNRATAGMARGVDLLQVARESMGPVRQIHLIGEGTFDPSAQLQGYRPDSVDAVPFREELALTSDGGVGYESRYTRRDGTEEWLRYGYRGDEMQFVHVTDGFAVRVRDRSFEDAAARLARMLPHVLVSEALENRAAVRSTGEGSLGERVSVALGSGELVTLEIDSKGFVRAFDYFVDFPLLGDTIVRWVYGDYAPIGESRIPRGYEIRVADRVLKRVEWRVIDGDPADSAGFAIPEGVDAPAEPKPPGDPSPPPPPRVVERAPGIWQVQRLRSGFHPIFVELDDFVVAFEAPTGWLELHQVPAGNFVTGASSSSVSEEYVSLIHETVPGKPIRYLVLTHFHNDHSGGLRPFISEGARIVTTAGAVELLKQAAERPHRIAGDALQSAPREADFEIVRGRHVIASGDRRIELLPVENEHVEEMLVAWFPAEKILFISDLFLPLGKSFPSKAELPMNLEFVRWLDRSGLDPEMFLTIHGASRGTKEQITTLRRMASDGD